MTYGARRKRWRTAIVALILALAACLALAGSAIRADPLYVDAEVSATQSGSALPSGYVGLSLEYSALHRYTGRNPDQINPVFEQLVAALAPGASPVLRIGGDSSDHTWLPLPGLIEPAGVNYTLTGDWLATTRRMAQDLNARLILGVNLAADNPQVAGAEARALVTGIGGQHVDALEIGNEPDAYTRFAWYRTRTGQVGFARGRGWQEPAFQREFTQWSSVLPDVPLASPAYAYVNWMDTLGSLISANRRLGVVTFHRYPLRGCGPEANGPIGASIPHLMADSSSAGLAETVAPFVGPAHSAGLPFRVDELNSASCGGSVGTSNTFASALWILDTLFNMAAVGADGVNIHTLPGAAYAPFSFSVSHHVWHATVNPLYYGLLMFTQAFPAGAHLLAAGSASDAVKVWSTVDAAGTIRTVLINEDARPAVVDLAVQNRLTQPATVETLSAPALSSTTGVRLGGQSFAPASTTGRLGAPQTTELFPLLGHYDVTVPADSAVLVVS